MFRIPRPRFRLLTLLVVVTALCVWLGTTIERVQRQAAAVAQLQGLGAAVFFDHQRNAQGTFDHTAPAPVPVWARRLLNEDYFRKALCIRLWDVPLADDDMRAIAALRDLETLECYRCDFSQAPCALLGRLRQLKKLRLDQCKLGTTSLASVARLTRLAHLELSDMHVDDAMLPPLPQLTSLEVLMLEKVPVTGSRFGDLRRLSKLKTIQLYEVPFGDNGMRAIGSLPALEFLRLRSTVIGDEGLAHLAPGGCLQHVQIEHAAITDRGLMHVGRLKSLVGFALTDGRLNGSPQALESLERLGKLRFLTIEVVGDGKTDEALQRLREALPGCQVRCYDTALGAER